MNPIQKPADAVNVKNLGHEALHDLIHFDRKIFRTLPVLFLKPGLLTKKALSEERDRYVKPFTLFVFINFLFFLIKSKGIFAYTLDTYQNQYASFIQNKQIELRLSYQLISERFNTAIRFEEKEYLIIMVPLFALIVMLLYLNKRLHYARHLIFSLHFYSFFIIFLWVEIIALTWFQKLLNFCHIHLNIVHSERPFILLTIIFIGIYLFIALKNVYLQSNLSTLLKSFILSITVIGLIVFIYRIALFFLVMRSISE